MMKTFIEGKLLSGWTAVEGENQNAEAEKRLSVKPKVLFFWISMLPILRETTENRIYREFRINLKIPGFTAKDAKNRKREAEKKMNGNDLFREDFTR